MWNDLKELKEQLMLRFTQNFEKPNEFIQTVENDLQELKVAKANGNAQPKF